METLGEFLKREREFRNISLEGLAQSTKIGVHLLKAIEEDHLDLLPKGAFIRGFLKTYSRAVGLNSDDVLLRYQSLQPAAGRPDETDPFLKFRRFEVKNQLFYILLFLLGVIVLATYLSGR